MKGVQRGEARGSMESRQPLGKVWGAEGSMLPAWPSSELSPSVASMSGLGPPNRG